MRSIAMRNVHWLLASSQSTLRISVYTELILLMKSSKLARNM